MTANRFSLKCQRVQGSKGREQGWRKQRRLGNNPSEGTALLTALDQILPVKYS